MGELVLGNAAQIIEVVELVATVDTSYPVLLTLLRLKRGGLELDRSCSQVIARAMDRDPSRVFQLAQWVEAICSISEAGVIDRCVSVSCTSNGAQNLWRVLEPEMKSLGLDTRVHPVHCLARCENGPCLALVDEIYLGESESIHEDDRPWREAPFDQDL